MAGMMQNTREDMMACSPCPHSSLISDSPTTPTTPTTHHLHPSSPTVASSPPLTTQPPTLTSLCNATSIHHHTSPPLPPSLSSNAIHHHHMHHMHHQSSLSPSNHNQHHLYQPQHLHQSPTTTYDSSSSSKLSTNAADKTAALSNKLRMSRNNVTVSSGGLSGCIPPAQIAPTSFNSFRASLLEDTNHPYNTTALKHNIIDNNLLYDRGSSNNSSRRNHHYLHSLHNSSSQLGSDMDITTTSSTSSLSMQEDVLLSPLSGCDAPTVDTSTDIRVMSPSLVNSQVLSKTRPLSPPPILTPATSALDGGSSSNSNGMMADMVNPYLTQHHQHNPSSDITTSATSIHHHHHIPYHHNGANRETLSDVCGGVSGSSGMLPPASPLNNHHAGISRTDRRSSSDRRPSWSRKGPDTLQGSVRELLDSDDSMTSIKSTDTAASAVSGDLHRNQQQVPLPPAADEGKQSTKGRGGRGRRRPRLFKLKFHHQALPPEYLDHYEASLRQEQKLGPPPPPPPPLPSTPTPPPPPPSQSRSKKGSRGGSKTPRPITIHEAGSGATEALLRELLLHRPHLQQAALQQAALARAQSVPSLMMATKHRATLGSSTPSPVPSIAEEEEINVKEDRQLQDVVKSKRNSRKNRKAETKSMIGSSFNRDSSPGLMAGPDIATNLGAQYAAMEQEAMSRSRSYTSLLRVSLADQNEPLNLCVRDTPLKLEDENCMHDRVKEEPLNTYTDILRPPSACIRSPDAIMRRSNDARTPMSPPVDYGPWSNSFAHHPQWMHDYRLKTEDGLSSGQSTPSLCSQSSHLPPISPPAWPHFSPTHLGSPHPHSPSPSPMTPPHRNVHALLKESLHLRLEEAARERLTPHDAYMPSPDRMSSNTPIPPLHPSSIRSPSRGGARKKRSTIYVPHPEANSEVSICKFKFTGGPNPMLEEKKMVSVDASGTMRYFTGGERGIPRDHRTGASQLRLSGKLIGNISKSEKDNKKMRLEARESNEDTRMNQSSTSLAENSAALESPLDTRQLNQVEDSPKRKRRSKKASVRERFEQTLRERGLLIQTQQVESAEGATYCKFRQLRKITRYLFRSWKDYLPGQLPEDGSMPEQACNPPHMEGMGNQPSPQYAGNPR